MISEVQYWPCLQCSGLAESCWLETGYISCCRPHFFASSQILNKTNSNDVNVWHEGNVLRSLKDCSGVQSTMDIPPVGLTADENSWAVIFWNYTRAVSCTWSISQGFNSNPHEQSKLQRDTYLFSFLWVVMVNNGTDFILQVAHSLGWLLPRKLTESAAQTLQLKSLSRRSKKPCLQTIPNSSVSQGTKET